ncbi:hypothetical protein ACP6EW_01640 [Hafnia paralvei]|uniref:hypothetical protein n=1 Tax=Hafnia paralvei TaxID=546367 RepID=UPI003CEEE6D8
MMHSNSKEKKLIIDWLECNLCDSSNIEVTTVKGTPELLYEEDKCQCLDCGASGVIECDDGIAWANWHGEQSND